MCGNTRRDNVRNEDILIKMGSPHRREDERKSPTMVCHVRRKPTDAPVRRVELIDLEQVKRAKGRPKKTQMEVIRQNIETKGLNKDI